MGDTQRIYVYKLRTENGSAPAVFRSQLSLAICKPKIRATADVGDWIIGVAGKDLRPGAPLIYVAQVTDVIENGLYYLTKRYLRRPDNIYKWRNARLKLMPPPQVHDESDESRDIGTAPLYKGARVLLSQRYRYFGRSASDWYAGVSPVAHQLAQAVGRGHRVNHPDEDHLAWMKVIRAAMKKTQLRVKPIEFTKTSCKH